MRIPRTPPSPASLLEVFKENSERFIEIILKHKGPLAKGNYRHWDKLIYLKPPEALTHEEWWLALKTARMSLYKPTPLLDRGGKPFVHLTLDEITQRLHEIDLGTGGMIQTSKQITNADTRDRYYISSLIEEAITSSQLEGATTTRVVAKEMIRSGRTPKDRSEQMILNNFLTMRRIGEIKGEALTPEMVFDLHSLVTTDTLEKPDAAGRFRGPDEEIVVGDDYGRVFHQPPPSQELEKRMRSMCEFANDRSSSNYVHPVIRSIILHFWLAHDHPFYDGNGRTARALFYWSMLNHGYWLFEFVSISQTILKAPAQYGRAFLLSETDDNDLTYFVLYHLDVISKATRQLHDYIERKTAEVRDVERSMQGVSALNHRQRALIVHALRHPGFRYTIESHQKSHNVVYQTARSDLLNLAERELVEARKVGRTWHFTALGDLEKRLRDLR